MRIGIRLALAFFIVAFVSVSIVGYISYAEARKNLQEGSFDKLRAVREMKAGQIEDYFGLIQDQIVTFSENPMIIEAMTEFENGFNLLEDELQLNKSHRDSADQRLENYFYNEYLVRLDPNMKYHPNIKDEISSNEKVRLLQDLYISSNPYPVGEKHHLDSVGNSTSYDRAHQKYHPVIRNFLDKFGYYDIFLVDEATGNIVYSVFKEVDFGTSLISGPFQHTNLARVFNESQKNDNKDFTSIVDFEPYHPSYNAPASFIASPIYNDTTQIGVLIFQMPIHRIDDVMTSHQKWADVGLGETGETYIVGDDYTLRNQSRFLIEDSLDYFKLIKGIGVPESTIVQIRNFNSSIGLQEVKTQGTEAALAGETGEKIFQDYRGVPVLSAYRPLHINGLDWVIMSEIDEEEAFSKVYALRSKILLIMGGMVILIILASFSMSRAITSPVKKLTGHARLLARGNMDVEIDIARKDEIGILAISFRKMQASVKRLINELKDINQDLENKVIERTREIQLQKDKVEEQNREIVDSINYAQRLQHAIIPTVEEVNHEFPDSFVLFRPKDIVSGDFYWMVSSGDHVSVAVADCTGHGVPGAMVSVVGANSLNRCVKEFGLKQPAQVLDKLRELIVETFESSSHEIKDGMDISYFSIDRKTGTIQWAGANNPLWIVRKGSSEVEEVKADKQPVGKFIEHAPFTNHNIELTAGDCIYIFTDGYADQFGGERGKKYKYKPFKEFLISISNEPMQLQGDLINKQFVEWKGDFEQVDDVCVIGVRL